jgi:heat shock protein HslJ
MYSTSGQVIEIGPVASTRMAGPAELMSLEHHFYAHLEGAHQIRLEGDVMTLGRGEDEIVLNRALA